jgi:hypothetical protein
MLTTDKSRKINLNQDEESLQEEEEEEEMHVRLLPDFLHRPSASPTMTPVPTSCAEAHPLNPYACMTFVQVEIDVEYRYLMTYQISGFLPSKKVFINLEVVFLLASVMFSVKRIWKVVMITSLLYLVCSYPIIVGNGSTMTDNNLWPSIDGENDKECYDFFSGKALLYPSRQQSKRLCTDTRISTIGGILSFVAMHLLFIASCLLFYLGTSRGFHVPLKEKISEQVDASGNIVGEALRKANLGIFPQHSTSVMGGAGGGDVGVIKRDRSEGEEEEEEVSLKTQHHHTRDSSSSGSSGRGAASSSPSGNSNRKQLKNKRTPHKVPPPRDGAEVELSPLHAAGAIV